MPGFPSTESQYTGPLHALFALVLPAAAVGPTIWIHLEVGVLATGRTWPLRRHQV